MHVYMKGIAASAADLLEAFGAKAGLPSIKTLGP
jgi:hypothetical protein